MRDRVSFLFGLIALLAVSMTPAAHAGTPVPQDYACGPGNFLIGFQGHLGVWVDQMQPVCAHWDSLHGQFGPAQPGPVFGNAHGGGVDLYQAICPPAEAIMRVGYGWAFPNGKPGHVQGVAVFCAAMKDGQVDNNPVNLGNQPEGKPFASNPCGGGQVANGVTIGLDGINLTDLTPICVAPPAPSMMSEIEHHPGVMQPAPAPAPAPAAPVKKIYHPGMFGPGSPVTPAPAPAAVPPSSVIEGDWNTSEGPMTLNQDGNNRFEGTYSQDSGRIKAHREGGAWKGDWSEGSSAHRCNKDKLGSHYWGQVDLTFSNGNRHFDGQWEYCNDPSFTKSWTGDRIK